MIIDPSTKRQTPLIGTLFAFIAGMVFFATDGDHDLFRLIGQTLLAIPVGSLATTPRPELFIAQISAMFMLGVVAAGASMMVLLLTDIGLAVVSRALPQMNILMISLQVKSIVLLTVLALASGLMAPVILRAFETSFGFIQKVFA